jgi:hypothetical protein
LYRIFTPGSCLKGIKYERLNEMNHFDWHSFRDMRRAT